MSIIKILPDILSNKIAAGEVVERPASVVKELVENAIDAKSDKISVAIEQGGRSLIQVADNGQGMSHDDALLSIERYATSKIYTDADLYAIQTLGFRGEALPSIAAVSKFTLTTKDASSMAGTEVQVEGGRILKVSETGAPQGTMIAVRQLFFNTPARRKFLKAVGTEMAHIADMISCTALAWPQIQFRLEHNHKTVKSWSRAENPFDRLIDVVGHDLLTLMHPLAFNHSDIQLSGWISDPSVTRATSQKIYIYINGRHVKDRGIQYALFEGYKGRMMKGQFPVAVLFLVLPPDQVDVNVHPTKSEVRFARQSQVYEAVRTAVEQTWKTRRQASWAPAGSERQQPRISEPLFSYPFLPKQAKMDTKIIFKKNPEPDFFSNTPAQIAPDTFLGKMEKARVRSEEHPLYELAESVKTNSPQKFADCSVIGQFRNLYILCEYGDDLVVIDQHAAHERIVYEKLKRQQARKGEGQRQTLMIPETIELSFKESALIEQMVPDLCGLGLEIEHFGGNTFVVKSVPALLAESTIKPLIVEIAETMDAVGYSPGLADALDQCLILMACHGAIRAHQSLSIMEIRELLFQLDQCENPNSCPHGRPTVIRWPLKQFEKGFKRTA
ncbi:MAG: DNA mismatch repair endonuclease MutL [Desulfobacterales bacterium]|jgi:DNA mismatch repair protein MutL|nr:DNA mismatch repair endonuclease MutL [Desulfobacterales bacterium]